MQIVELSIVIPTYGSADCLKTLHQRLTAVLSKLTDSYEIIFVEDCSPDKSWEILTDLAGQDPKIQAYKLSRNFGQHAAITAGLSKSRGRWAVVMDCDLQDPPEDVPRLYERALQGYDIVLAKRMERQHSLFRSIFARLYAFILRAFSRTNFTGEHGSFSIISRPVIDAYLGFADKNRHYLLILLWLGFNMSKIEYIHAKRLSGKSAYSLKRLLQHAIQGVFFQTTVLLRAIVVLGLMVSVCGIAIAGVLLFNYLIHSVLPGWTSIAVLILVLGGVILMSLGIVGMYIGEIFDQVKSRPLFVIAKSAAEQ